MATRKSPSERVSEYKAKAAQIEERERRKLLARSPQWLATLRAISSITLAIECLPEGSSALRDALELANEALVGVREDEID